MRYHSRAHLSWFAPCTISTSYFVAERKTAATGLQKAPLIVILSATGTHPRHIYSTPTYSEGPRTRARAIPTFHVAKVWLMHGMIPKRLLRGDQWRFGWFLATQCLHSLKALAGQSLGPQKSAASRLSHTTPWTLTDMSAVCLLHTKQAFVSDTKILLTL
jgi:hypothetical protein